MTSHRKATEHGSKAASIATACMEFSVKPAELKRALAILKPCVASSAKRIFECVRLEAEGGTLQLSSTDLEWAAVVDVVADVAESGAAVVPFGELAKLARLKAERITFEALAECQLKATWRGPRTTAERTIDGEPAEQYPEIPEPRIGDYPATWHSAPELGITLLEAIPFAGKEAARFVLNGLRIDAGGITATDGRRLYRRDVHGLEGADAIVSTRTLARFPKPALRSVECWQNGGKAIHFRGPGFRLTARLMEGTFPDYGQIMPKGLPSCRIDADAWLEALEAVDGCASVEAQAVALTFNGAVRVSAAGADSKGEATIPQETGDLEGIGRLGFNPAYLRDFLKLQPTRFGAKNANSAAQFTTEHGAELVLMPVLID